MRRRRTREQARREVAEYLRGMYADTGKVPAYADVPGWVQASSRQHFDRWNDAILFAGMTPREPGTKDPKEDEPPPPPPPVYRDARCEAERKRERNLSRPRVTLRPARRVSVSRAWLERTIERARLARDNYAAPESV